MWVRMHVLTHESCTHKAPRLRQRRRLALSGPGLLALRGAPMAGSAASAPGKRKRQRSGAPAGPGAYARRLADATGLGLEPPPPLAPLRAAAPGRARLTARPRPAEPLPDSLRGAFLPAFVARAAASLPARVWAAICSHVDAPAEGPVTLTFGTACSGSEFYLTAMPLVAAEISARLRREVRFVHLWSCELDPQKRQWIVDNFAPPKLFGDITALAQATCHDYVSGASAAVDAVDFVIAGTSCKDASRLNPHHVQRLDAVETGAHTTGGTFKGFAQLVAKFGLRCRLVVLENVASLRDRDPRTGRSNFDGVCDAVRSLGFGFVSAEFSARDVGLPVARPRLYMSGVRCADEREAQRLAHEVLGHIVRSARPVALDALLLPEGAPHLTMRDWMREGLARESAQRLGVEEEGLWPQQHRRFWADVPPAVLAQLAPQYEANPWFHTLPHRQRDLLLLTVCQNAASRRRPLAIPLNTSLTFGGPGSPTCLPTLVPTGVLWLVGRGRPLLGVEAVRLQGCDPASLPGLGPETHDSAFLIDLAGNAFCVYQFCSWFFAALATSDMVSRDVERFGAGRGT